MKNALKAAFDWKARKLGLDSKDTHDFQVIHFKEAFHGRTGYTLSLTNTADPKKYLYFPKFDWPRVHNPKIDFPINDTNNKNVEAAEKKSLDEIKQAIQRHPRKIAALIIEPIQGEGGDNHFRREFLQSLRTITQENDILLVFDEVQTGMGTTGKMWAHEHFDCQPDLIAFGKKNAGVWCRRHIKNGRSNGSRVPTF